MTLAAPHPFSLVLFGASGHLAKLKIYPALYTLALKKRLPPTYAVVGYARSAMTDEAFRALVVKSVHEGMMGAVNDVVLKEFLTHFHYQQGQYDQEKDFVALRGTLETLEGEPSDPWVRLAYLSVPPTVYTAIFTNLCKGKIHEKGKPFRCIVEKPVGHDLKSFEEIRSHLTECFAEDEIFLLDHYLGKEAVRNVSYLRFANPVLERLLKNTIIKSVEIVADESRGIEGRAGYFENTGMLRDWVQSHLLMIASLLTMRLSETEDSLRANRLNALEQFYLPPAANIDDLILQGQYTEGSVGGTEVPGYREEPDVAADSRTNTFVAVKLKTRISRWEGVPFTLRAGKRLAKKETRISIVFQEPRIVGKGATTNRLDIILLGEAGMRLHLQTRISGTEPSYRPLVLADPLVCVGDCLPEHGILLLEAIHGRQNWFLSFDEARTAWRLVDPLQVHLDAAPNTLHNYASGSRGPSVMDTWMTKDGIAWME